MKLEKILEFNQDDNSGRSFFGDPLRISDTILTYLAPFRLFENF